MLFESPGSTEDDPSFTEDLLELYFDRDGAIWVSKRVTPAAPWGAPFEVTELALGWVNTSPRVSRDGLTLWFATNLPPSIDYDIWRAERADRTAPWGDPTHATGLSTAARDVGATFTRDGLQAIVTRRDLPPESTWSLFLHRRDDVSSAWDGGVLVGELETGANEGNGHFVPDDLVFFFDTDFGGPDRDLAVTTRPGPDAPFAAPTRIDALSMSGVHEEDIWLSEDLRYAVFASDRSGNMELYEARR